MEEITKVLLDSALQVLGVVLMVVGTFIGQQINKYIQQLSYKANIENGEQIAKTVVESIQQVYTQLNGEEKFAKAKDRMIVELNAKGINLTEKQVDMLIEQAVFGIKDGYKDNKFMVGEPIGSFDSGVLDVPNVMYVSNEESGGVKDEE